MANLEILDIMSGPSLDVHCSEFVPCFFRNSPESSFTSLFGDTERIYAPALLHSASSSSSSTNSYDSDIDNLLDFELWPSQTERNSEDKLRSRSTTQILETTVDAFSFFNLLADQNTLFESGENPLTPRTEDSYIDWILAIVALKGGKISESNLYEEMKSSNSALYNTVVEKFGGVIQLLVKHPDQFGVVNDAPFQWSIVSLKQKSGSLLLGGVSLKNQSKKIFKKDPSRLSETPIDEKVVDKVIETAAAILKDASHHTLKAVELANTLRACVGVEPLSAVKEHFGGLLCLLQKYPDTFSVERIPKNDMVSLVNGAFVAGNVRINNSSDLIEIQSRPATKTSQLPGQCIVQKFLTSEEWVPNKAWPSESRRDMPYVSVIADQLHSAGGTMTVSKLRGLIRVSLNLKDTIKSVPLKALIKAYGNIFVLSGNQVSLVRL